MSRPRRERTLTLIIAYKFGRAGASVVVAVVLLVLSALGVTDHVEHFVQNIHDHAASELNLTVSALALSALAPQHLLVAFGALLLDALLLGVEGWALWRNWKWAPWLVAGASGALLPFEIGAIVAHVSVERVLLLVFNLAIVAYLLIRTWRKRGHAAPTQSLSPERQVA